MHPSAPVNWGSFIPSVLPPFVFSQTAVPLPLLFPHFLHSTALPRLSKIAANAPFLHIAVPSPFLFPSFIPSIFPGFAFSQIAVNSAFPSLNSFLHSFLPSPPYRMPSPSSSLTPSFPYALLPLIPHKTSSTFNSFSSSLLHNPALPSPPPPLSSLYQPQIFSKRICSSSFYFPFSSFCSTPFPTICKEERTHSIKIAFDRSVLCVYVGF